MHRKCSRSRCIPQKRIRTCCQAARPRKTEAWLVLEAGTTEPHLCGPEGGHDCSDLRRALANGTVAKQLACIAPKAWRQCFLTGRDGSLAGWRHRWCSRFNRTATLHFASTTGTMWTRRQANQEHFKSSRQLPASICRGCGRPSSACWWRPRRQRSVKSF